MKIRGWDQKTLAEKVGKTQATISNWEQFGDLKFSDLQRVAGAFGMTVPELTSIGEDLKPVASK